MLWLVSRIASRREAMQSTKHTSEKGGLLLKGEPKHIRDVIKEKARSTTGRPIT